MLVAFLSEHPRPNPGRGGVGGLLGQSPDALSALCPAGTVHVFRGAMTKSRRAPGRPTTPLPRGPHTAALRLRPTSMPSVQVSPAAQRA